MHNKPRIADLFLDCQFSSETVTVLDTGTSGVRLINLITLEDLRQGPGKRQ